MQGSDVYIEAYSYLYTQIGNMWSKTRYWTKFGHKKWSKDEIVAEVVDFAALVDAVFGSLASFGPEIAGEVCDECLEKEATET